MSMRKGGRWLHKWLPILLVGLIAGVAWFCSAKIKERRQRVCLNNLRLIDSAVYNVFAEQKYQRRSENPCRSSDKLSSPWQRESLRFFEWRVQGCMVDSQLACDNLQEFHQRRMACGTVWQDV